MRSQVVKWGVSMGAYCSLGFKLEISVRRNTSAASTTSGVTSFARFVIVSVRRAFRPWLLLCGNLVHDTDGLCVHKMEVVDHVVM